MEIPPGANERRVFSDTRPLLLDRDGGFLIDDRPGKRAGATYHKTKNPHRTKRWRHFITNRNRGVLSQGSPGNPVKQHKSMHYAPLSQQSGHLPEKSTTMWTTPQTEEQRRYFSKHAPKRRVYGAMMFVFQCLHSFLAFAAWKAIFDWAFTFVPMFQPAAPFMAGIMLIAMHALFGVTWSTYWYDKLDNDPKTDSGVALPILLIVALLAAEIYGSTEFFQGLVKPAEQRDVAVFDNHSARTGEALEKQYASTKAEIAALYTEKAKAATLPFDNRIAALQRRRIDSDAERKSIAGQIAAIKRQRDQAAEPIAAEKAAALAEALADYKRKSARAYDVTEAQRSEALAHNTAEAERYQRERANAGSLAWLISVVLLSIIAGLGYVRVRINVKSGIIPQRNFTVLDAHGSAFERIATAFGDAFNRRSLQLAVWFHRFLSPNHALQSFDGTVVATPGQYNTPKGVFTEHNTPAPPSDGESLGAAYAKVFAKVERIRQQVPNYTPSKPVLDNEMSKALTMNGSYNAADWEDPTLLLGKT